MSNDPRSEFEPSGSRVRVRDVRILGFLEGVALGLAGIGLMCLAGLL